MSKIKDFFRRYWEIITHGATRDRIIAIAVIALLIWVASSFIWSFANPDKETYIPTSDFVAELQNGNVGEMHISNLDGTVNGKLKEPNADGVISFSSHIPERSETFTQTYLNTGDIQWDYSKTPEWISNLTSLFMMLLQIGLLVGAMMWIMSKMSGDSSMFPFFGDDKGEKWIVEKTDVSLSDVAGVPEAIEEVEELISFLKDPTLYEQAGAERIKGCVLYGPAGTGKTMLAKAIATEVGSGGNGDCVFMSASGSEFVKLYVGQGAKTVRELFKQARSYAPTPVIVFIDELDALGGARSATASTGADSEKDQTLNQFLVELDGIGSEKDNILVIGATNRIDALDPALVRKGRFDRLIQVDAPAKEGRIEILQHYAQDRPFAAPVDFDRLAKHTSGFSGADLKNVMNEASSLAARRASADGGQPVITKEDLDEGISRTISGPAMKSRKMNDEEKRQVAYHEAGHAVVQYIIPECDPVQKISIVSRNVPGVGAAMGYVQSYAEEDTYVMTSAKLSAEIAALMGGRCSEKMHCEIESAGAIDDLKKASSFAYDMVNKYAFDTPQGEHISWRVEVPSKSRRDESSQRRLEQNDERIETILETGYDTARRILSAHRPEVEAIVATLLEDETIDSEQIKEIMESSYQAAEMGQSEFEISDAVVSSSGTPADTKPEERRADA